MGWVGGAGRTGMADSRVGDLNAHFVGPGRADLDGLDAEGLSGLPCDGRLAGDCLRFKSGNRSLRGGGKWVWL